jgi:opacity protein-like surface antigen
VRSSNKKITSDREDPNLDLGWQRESEKGGLRVAMHYDKTSSRLTELRNSGLVDKDGTATNKSISAGWTNQINDRLIFGLDGQYSKTKYTRSNFINSTTKSLNASLNYEMNERVSPFVQAGITKFESDTKTTAESVSAGAKLLLNPNFTFTPSVGINHVSSAGNGWIANLGFNYIGEKYLLDGSIGRNVSPSAIGSFQKSDRLGVTYSYELSDKDRLGADFSWSKNKSDINSETKQLSGWFSRELSQNWQMRLFAETKKLKDEDLSADGNIIGINFIYNTLEF